MGTVRPLKPGKGSMKHGGGKEPPDLGENALRVLEKRYLKTDRNGDAIETPADMFRRVARAVAEAEALYGGDADVKAWEEKGLLEVMDLYMVPHSQGLVEPIDRRRGKIQFSIENELETLVKRSKAKHVVLDPLTSILIHESRSGRKRFMVSQLFQTIRDLGCTSLITSEGIPSEGDFYMEQFLADGVILLEKNLQEFQYPSKIRNTKIGEM